MSKDVRAPADPQDFETLVNAVPLSPANFRVVKTNEGDLRFEVTDRNRRDAGRGTPLTYRFYWVPSSVLPSSTISPDQMTAGRSAGTFVGSVQASGRGGLLTSVVVTQNEKKGWYVCVGANSSGRESDATAMAMSPWGL